MIFHVLTAIVAWNVPQVQAVADVTAPAGRVAGLELDVLGTTVNAFVGILFAKPPIGARRFRPAEPLEPWDGIYNATRKPHACSQRSVVDLSEHFAERNMTTSEDCLYLNVWQPYPAPTRAAVMVWIHGGGFQFGSSLLVPTDGRYLAATEGVIVVSFNYRLSTLGFLYAGTDDAPGNLGLTDQVLALQWVQDNIAAFGGDPAKVTIFGESAGGTSVAYHVISPDSRSLFSRAIQQSGTLFFTWGFDSRAAAYNKTARFAKALGCPTEQGSSKMLACLRYKDLQQVIDTSVVGYTSFFPVIENPTVAYDNGTFNKVDILLGTNKNEGNYFIVSQRIPGFSIHTESLISREQFVQNIPYGAPFLNEFGVNAVAFQYTDWRQLHRETVYRDALDSLFGDVYFNVPTVKTARAHLKHGATPYMYQFAHRSSTSRYPAWMGVIHGDEIPFVFGLPLNPAHGYTEEEKVLTRRMMRHWANFAKTGDPNDNNYSVWSAYNETYGGYMVLDMEEPWMLHGPKAVELAFWDNYVPSLMAKTESLKNSPKTPRPCTAASGALWNSKRTACFGMILLSYLLAVIQLLILCYY